MIDERLLTPNEVGEFLRLIDDLGAATSDMSMRDVAEQVIDASGLIEFHGRGRR